MSRHAMGKPVNSYSRISWFYAAMLTCQLVLYFSRQPQVKADNKTYISTLKLPSLQDLIISQQATAVLEFGSVNKSGSSSIDDEFVNYDDPASYNIIKDRETEANVKDKLDNRPVQPSSTNVNEASNFTDLPMDLLNNATSAPNSEGYTDLLAQEYRQEASRLPAANGLADQPLDRSTPYADSATQNGAVKQSASNSTTSRPRGPKQLTVLDYTRRNYTHNYLQTSFPAELATGSRTRIILSGSTIRNQMAQQGSNFSRVNQQDAGNADRATITLMGDPSQGLSAVPERFIMSTGSNDDTVQMKPPQRHIITISGFAEHQGPANRTQQKPDTKCPAVGVLTFEHPTACDKYYLCEDGLQSEVTCPNGLMYGVRDMVVDFCVHRWKVFCGDKGIPNPISSPGCRWQYGLFQVQGSPKCSANYYECKAGKFRMKRCTSEGQVYDDRSKSCQPAEVLGCANEAVGNFRCPPNDQNNPFWPFPRYFLNERAIIHCVNEKPELISCSQNERVHPDFLHCRPREELSHLYASEDSNSKDKAAL